VKNINLEREKHSVTLIYNQRNKIECNNKGIGWSISIWDKFC